MPALRGVAHHHSRSNGGLAGRSRDDAMSVDLKKRGFKFIGSTICYAFMQATGMVNDHLLNCFRYKEVNR